MEVGSLTLLLAANRQYSAQGGTCMLLPDPWLRFLLLSLPLLGSVPGTRMWLFPDSVLHFAISIV